MLKREVYLRRYDWVVLFHFSSGAPELERILDALIWADAPDSVLRDVEEKISAGILNEGFCFSNPMLRRTVLWVGETSTGPEFLNTIIHEIVHITQDVAHTEGIDPFGEDFAYLSGDISHEISDIVCEMSCPHCRGE